MKNTLTKWEFFSYLNAKAAYPFMPQVLLPICALAKPKKVNVKQMPRPLS